MSEAAVPVKTIRIALVEVKGLMNAVVKDAIARDRCMVVVEEVGSLSALATTEPRAFDVVVTSLRPGETHLDPAFQKLLFQFPHVPVVAFSGEGDTMEVFDRNVVRRVAPAQIPEAIRNSKARAS